MRRMGWSDGLERSIEGIERRFPSFSPHVVDRDKNERILWIKKRNPLLRGR